MRTDHTSHIIFLSSLSMQIDFGLGIWQCVWRSAKTRAHRGHNSQKKKTEKHATSSFVRASGFLIRFETLQTWYHFSHQRERQDSVAGEGEREGIKHGGVLPRCGKCASLQRRSVSADFKKAGRPALAQCARQNLCRRGEEIKSAAAKEGGKKTGCGFWVLERRIGLRTRWTLLVLSLKTGDDQNRSE